MDEDVPADVRAVLGQLFAEGQRAVEAGDDDTAREEVSTAHTVATNKLPPGDLRAELRHGCERTRALLTAEDPDREAAAEYLAAMERRLAATE